MIKSLVKGKGYERKIAKLLSDSFGIKFNRVPMSGGFQKRQNVEDAKFRGDIFTEDKSFNQTHNTIIECKKVKNPVTLLDYIKLMNKEKCVLSTWVDQCIEECKDSESNFWLIFAWNRSKDFIIIGDYLDELSKPVPRQPVLLKDFLKRWINGL